MPSCHAGVWVDVCREPKEAMTETVSHTFKRDLHHVNDRRIMDTLSRVVNGSVNNSVYVCHSL